MLTSRHDVVIDLSRHYAQPGPYAHHLADLTLQRRTARRARARNARSAMISCMGSLLSRYR